MAPRTTKTRTEFVCNECGGTTAKWQGQCPHCKAWNTLQEFKVSQGAAARYGAGSPRSAGGFVDTTGSLQDLSDVAIEEIPRTVTGLGEFDRVMGGGLVKGCVALIGGDPASASRRFCCRSWPDSSSSAIRRFTFRARKAPRRSRSGRSAFSSSPAASPS